MPLLPMNGEDFQAAVADGKLVMVYFWTDWREACQEATPIIEEVASYYDDAVVICSVNADEAGFLALDLEVYSIPTVILFQNGEERNRIPGVQPAHIYQSLLDSYLHPEAVNPYDLIDSMGYS